MIGFHSKPYLMQVAPTGIGKSLIYVAGSLHRGGRTIILTSTKGLQDQLMKDFAPAGLVEVRGRSNHRCDLTGNSASLGPCRWGYKCALREGGCAYYDSIRRANEAQLVVTNYAFWLSNDGILEAETLVLDEAHASFDHLVSHYSVELDMNLAMGILGHELELSRAGIAEALKESEKYLRAQVKHILKEGGDISKISPLSRLVENIRTLSSTLKLTAIKSKHKGTLYVTPVTAPTDRLFRGSRFVLLTSATVGEGTARLLGLTPSMIDILSYNSPFPVMNRPIYALDGFKIDRKTSQATDRQWAVLIDQIVRSRPGHKGIVHTVSYDRRAKYLKNSHLKIPVLSPNPKETASFVAQFKHKDPPAVLVSPSVTTGYDFPGDECRYQVIGKVPFPDSSSELSSARTKVFPDYPLHAAWQQIVQASGRGVRSEDDWCETFIVDAHFHWLLRKAHRLAPKWFVGAIKSSSTIPKQRSF